MAGGGEVLKARKGRKTFFLLFYKYCFLRLLAAQGEPRRPLLTASHQRPEPRAARMCDS